MELYKISIKIIDWLKRQIQIENDDRAVPDIHDRDIFWVRIGYNVGH